MSLSPARADELGTWSKNVSTKRTKEMIIDRHVGSVHYRLY